MSYIKYIQSPNLKLIIEEKWHSIKSEKISTEEKLRKWKEYINELESVKLININELNYLILNYKF